MYGAQKIVMHKYKKAFTVLELVIVIVILGVLAAFALPRYFDLKEEAKISTLENIQGSLKSLVTQVKAAAVASGLSPLSANPGGSSQSSMVIHTNLGSFEVDWRNLCPESRAELLDRLTTLDFIDFGVTSSGQLQTRLNNQYTWIGYSLPPGQCYVVYDSFACTVTVVSSGC